jgi:PKHD-type hydroxylase
MHLAIDHAMDAAAVERVTTALDGVTFVDGRITAGPRAASVKDNAQADGSDIEPIRDFVRDALMSHPVFALAARPKAIIGPTFSRYRPGQSYGRHVDEPIMAGQRTDIAFTLFLSDPATYDGGDLVIESAAGEEAVKLAAGGVFVYCATTLHRVAPVTRGERLAAVGWVRSTVRRADQREILFDLGTVLHGLTAEAASTADTDLLAKSIANLTRLWCDD